MAICLKRVRGLKRVRVADAAWIWTEPHSMRLKVRLTIQKEVAPGAILQKPLDCEFVVRNQQCTDCRQQFENFAWTAAVQVRQRVSHKRTFFYLEQAILKKNAQAAAVKIEQFRDGLDFFFRQRNDAVRFVQFLKDCVPCRVKETKKLVSAGAISASRRVVVCSRHRRDSCPSHDAVGGFFFEFEAIRTASRDRDAPRRCWPLLAGRFRSCCHAGVDAFVWHVRVPGAGAAPGQDVREVCGPVGPRVSHF